MPKSRVRKKPDYTPPPTKKAPVKLDRRGWVAPTFCALFIIGLMWIVVYYITGGSWPIPDIGGWNIAIGFGFIAAGFGVSTQWK